MRNVEGWPYSPDGQLALMLSSLSSQERPLRRHERQPMPGQPPPPRSAPVTPIRSSRARSCRSPSQTLPELTVPEEARPPPAADAASLPVQLCQQSLDSARAALDLALWSALGLIQTVPRAIAAFRGVDPEMGRPHGAELDAMHDSGEGRSGWRYEKLSPFLVGVVLIRVHEIVI